VAAALREAGVQFAWFNPITFKFWRRRRADFRTHRKSVVCDGVVGFTGGMNVADAHSAEFGPGYWRDTHLGFAGPAVAALQRAFLEDWAYARGTLPTLDTAYFPVEDLRQLGAHDAVQVVGSGPDDPAYAVYKTYFAAITAARQRLWITTPYFIPDDAIMTALAVAALARVDVRVLVPKRGDSAIVDLAARSYFGELLAAGVKIYEYEPRFIHAKTMVVDDDLAIVATANLDNRSFRLNFELAAQVYGAALNARLARAFIDDLEHARPAGAGRRPRAAAVPAAAGRPAPAAVAVCGGAARRCGRAMIVEDAAPCGPGSSRRCACWGWWGGRARGRATRADRGARAAGRERAAGRDRATGGGIDEAPDEPPEDRYDVPPPAARRAAADAMMVRSTLTLLLGS
jgi:phosphatidylserine/phosphatidylglycerophosphate/cardiolipin synthase-like enzyme